jgi:5-methyltetrahydropteroyltriglutamate--homocysteine methyltransferase
MLERIENTEIERIIKRQEDIGLQSITDGELRRSWWHLDFLWELEGVGRHDTNAGVHFVGASPRTEGVRIDGPIAFRDHPMIAHFEFLDSHTTRTAKMTIPSPSAIYGRPLRPPINPDVYLDIDALFDDLGRAYADAVQAFAAAGCRYLQLDEVFIAMLCDPNYRAKMVERGDDPDKLTELYARAINTAVAEIPADMTITMHMCRGNFRSTFMGTGGYEAVEDVLFNRINVHGYFMEYDDPRSGGFEPLRLLPKGKTVALGLVTTKTGTLESEDELKRRIDEAARFAELDQLCLAPQCGFASTEEGNVLSEDEQWAKLERIVEVAGEVWG